jgi:hypothetical protein
VVDGQVCPRREGLTIPHRNDAALIKTVFRGEAKYVPTTKISQQHEPNKKSVTKNPHPPPPLPSLRVAQELVQQRPQQARQRLRVVLVRRHRHRRAHRVEQDVTCRHVLHAPAPAQDRPQRLERARQAARGRGGVSWDR